MSAEDSTERSYGLYRRSIALPNEIGDDNIKADFAKVA
jgi:HSP20 family molecular chaperone IbpA